jgi:hypothetical protein
MRLKKKAWMFCGAILLAAVLMMVGGAIFAKPLHISNRQPAEKPISSPKTFPYATYDTLLWFGGEDSLGQGSWNDRITGTPWITEDRTADRVVTMWHPDTFRAISGDTSMWWGDPEIGGYASELYEALLSPALFISADKDSLFLIYKHHIRCEEMHGWEMFEGWDGYNVRIRVAGADTMFEKIAPYQVAADSSFYRHPPDPDNEWNILRCWEFHGEQIGPYGEPYDQWIGGFACDGTGQGGDETVATKIFDLRPFAGDTIQVAFVGAADWGYDTSDDTTLFGFIVDDILVVEGLDSVRLAGLPAPPGGDTLFFDGFEGSDAGWERFIPNVPTGDWWWLVHEDVLTEPCKLMCSDSVTAEFIPHLDNFILSPKIAQSDLSGDMASLDLIWYLKADPAGQGDECYVFVQVKLDDDPWKSISVLTHPLGTAYIFTLEGISNENWWCIDQWSDWMHDMSPLVTDTTILWDTLQTALGLQTTAHLDTTGTVGLQVDRITLSGRMGAPYDIGISAMKIPGPNANDIEVIIDSVTIVNYGFNTAASGTYQVFMTVLDSNLTAVFGPTQVLAYGDAPNIDPLDQATVNLNDAATFTLTEEMAYDIKVYTSWVLDTTTVNDTLKLPYAAKADRYPRFYNYPAGQGELRHNDRGFYTYPDFDYRPMSAGDIAAVHFTPSDRFFPFDLRWAQPELADSAVTCSLKVWGSGPLPDEAPLLATVGFDPATGDSIDLSAIEPLQDLCSDFWIGVEFPAGGEAVMGMEMEESEPWEYLGRCWGRSYLKTDTTGWEWPPLDYDWLITAGISWRTVAPEIYKVKDDLHIIWDNVSQAGQYYIYRQTEPDTAIAAPFDSTPIASYTDTGAVGDTAVHYYYWLHTVHQDGQIYDKLSHGVGEFDIHTTNQPPGGKRR